MSFGGHVNDMVNRIKQNTALKDARRRKFKGGNDYSKVKRVKTEYKLPKFTTYNLSEFKKKVQIEAKLESIKRLQFWGILIFVILIALIIFNYF